MTTVPDRPAHIRALERRIMRLTVLDHWLHRGRATAAPRWDRRQASVEALWAASDLPRCEPTPVPGLPADASREALVEATRGFREPVVLRGFGASTAAVRQWSVAGLAERLGQAPCTVVEQDSASVERAHDSGRILHQMGFAEFVERMEDKPYYLHNSTEFATQRPELVAELELERFSRFAAPGSSWDELWSTNLFVGAANVFSSLHCAPGGNFFLQVSGRKTWTLVHPDLGPYLLPVLSKPFNHCLSGFGSYRHQRSHDPESPIFRLPRLEVTLAPGDLLYNPPWWWHEVENDGPTIGTALRHQPPPFSRSPTMANHRLYSSISVYPKLWAISALHWSRHTLTGRTAPLRDRLNVEFAKALNGARTRG